MSVTAEALFPRPAATEFFVDELYVAAIEPQRLSHALALFALMLDAQTAVLLVKDFTASGARTRLFERAAISVDGRLRDVQEKDIAEALGAEIPPGQERIVRGVLRSSDIPARRNRSANALHYLAATVKGGAWLSFAIVALRRGAPFTDLDRKQADDVLGDIRRALALRQLAARSASSLAINLRDECPIAVMSLREKRVEQRNAAAAALLEAGYPVALLEGQIRFFDKKAQAAFDAIGAAVVKPGRSVRTKCALLMKGRGDDAWIAQFAQSDQPVDAQITARPVTPAILVALTPINSASSTREQMLSGFAQLTPTERAILAAFVDGRGIGAIAASMDRSIETVRWHVRNLFTKLGVNTQADLTRLGALLLPI